jgi:hypothetical protein
MGHHQGSGHADLATALFRAAIFQIERGSSEAFAGSKAVRLRMVDRAGWCNSDEALANCSIIQFRVAIH